MKVQSLRLHPYAGSVHKRGSVYNIFREKDLNILVAIKAVKVVDDSDVHPVELKDKSKPKDKLKVKLNPKSKGKVRSKVKLKDKKEDQLNGKEANLLCA